MFENTIDLILNWITNNLQQTEDIAILASQANFQYYYDVLLQMSNIDPKTKILKLVHPWKY